MKHLILTTTAALALGMAAPTFAQSLGASIIYADTTYESATLIAPSADLSSIWVEGTASYNLNDQLNFEGFGRILANGEISNAPTASIDGAALGGRLTYDFIEQDGFRLTGKTGLAYKAIEASQTGSTAEMEGFEGSIGAEIGYTLGSGLNLVGGVAYTAGQGEVTALGITEDYDSSGYEVGLGLSMNF